jgi:hypothetical protein
VPKGGRRGEGEEEEADKNQGWRENPPSASPGFPFLHFLPPPSSLFPPPSLLPSTKYPQGTYKDDSTTQEGKASPWLGFSKDYGDQRRQKIKITNKNKNSVSKKNSPRNFIKKIFTSFFFTFTFPLP